MRSAMSCPERTEKRKELKEEERKYESEEGSRGAVPFI